MFTQEESVFSKPLFQENASLSPCSHEEAYSRMLLTAARHGHQKIMIRSVDTDVVALAVYVAQVLGPEYELWIAFGTGRHFRYLAAHEMASGLGPEKAKALPMFHGLTGCDAVSSFVGHRKKTAWATCNALPELTNALLALSNAPDVVQEEVFSSIEMFVILMYDRTSTCNNVDKARRKMFAKVKLILPTRGALEQHP